MGCYNLRGNSFSLFLFLSISWVVSNGAGGTEGSQATNQIASFYFLAGV